MNHKERDEITIRQTETYIENQTNKFTYVHKSDQTG